jgi:hypothetical protein
MFSSSRKRGSADDFENDPPIVLNLVLNLVSKGTVVLCSIQFSYNILNLVRVLILTRVYNVLLNLVV